MSTGAGSTPAGDVPAGFDPPGTVGSARDVKPPQALYLDAATMDFLTDTLRFARFLSLSSSSFIVTVV